MIHIHIGHAGIGIGEQLWEVLGAEHQIAADGLGCVESGTENTSGGGDHSSLYEESASGKWTPRAVFYDSDALTLDDSIRNRAHPLFRLFSSSSIHSQKEPTSGLCTWGHYLANLDPALDSVRSFAESCDALEGIILTHSLDGGTGGGCCSRLMSRLAVDFTVPLVNVTVMPSPSRISGSPIAPLNACISLPDFLQRSDMLVMVDNQAIYSFASSQLGIQSPSYSDLNRLVAEVTSSITSSRRFGNGTSPSGLKLSDIVLSCVPNPSSCPIVVPKLAHLTPKEMTTPSSIDDFLNFVPKRLIEPAFNTSGSLLTCDTDSSHRLLSSGLLFRGNVCPSDVEAALIRPQTVSQISDLSDPLLCSFSPQEMLTGPDWQFSCSSQSVVSLLNSTAVLMPLERLRRDFDVLYEKRSFLHWLMGVGIRERDLFPWVNDSLDAVLDCYRSQKRVFEFEEEEEEEGEDEFEDFDEDECIV